MGKRILAQRKGQGHLWARSPSHRHVGEVRYRSFQEKDKAFNFKITELIHSPGRGAPGTPWIDTCCRARLPRRLSLRSSPG